MLPLVDNLRQHIRNGIDDGRLDQGDRQGRPHRLSQ
jgi:hypothetical protein